MYSPILWSLPCRYAIVFPSGDQTGCASEPVKLVNFRGAEFAFASTTQISEFRLRSASADRLLVNAIILPSGDQTGPDSSKFSVVTVSVFFVAKSNRTIRLRLAPEIYPAPSRLNE